MARRKPVVSPRAVPPSADAVEVRPATAHAARNEHSFDDPDTDPDPDEEDEPSEDEEPIGDPPLSGFADDRARTRFVEGPEPDDDDFAWPGGPRVPSATAAASAGIGALPTFDPEHPPLPRVPLVGSPVDNELRGMGTRSFGNGHGGYDERAMPYERPVPRPPQPGAPQVSLGGPLPMWPDQADFDMTTQIVVKRREVDGSLANLGPFPKDATIDTLLAKYPNAGTYFVYPVDAQGREFDRHNPTRIDIPSDHEFFQRKKRVEALSPTGQVLTMAGGGSQVVAPEFMSLIEKLFSQKDAEAARLAEEVKRREDALEAREKLIRERDQALAVREIEHITTASKELLATANTQFSGVIQMVLALGTTQTAQAEAAAERERIRLESSHKAAMEQTQQTSKLMFEQFTAVTKIHTDVAERERQRDKDALEAEKTRIVEQGKLQTAFMNAEERRRQTVAAEEKKHEPKQGLADLTEMIDNYKLLKEAVGGGDDGDSSSSPWMGAFEKAAEMFQEAQRMKHEMRIEKMRMRAGYPEGVPLPPGFADDDEDEDSDDFGTPGQPALRGPIQGGMAGAPLPVGFAPQQAQQQPAPFAGLGAPMPQVLNQAGLPPAAMQPAATAPPSLAAPGAATVAPIFDPNFTDARRAVQMTIDRLAQEPNRQQWGDIVASSIIAVPSMLDYFRAVTVYGAMMDNGADDALANEVCTATAQIAAQNGIPIR